jgi:methenyltetrahydrofolate cyclohydrolase
VRSSDSPDPADRVNEAAGYAGLSVSAFLDALAAAAPAPAAGSAAALVLAQAAALCAKSARLSSHYVGDDRAGELVTVAEQVRAAATDMIDADAAAYKDVIAAARAARQARAGEPAPVSGAQTNGTREGTAKAGGGDAGAQAGSDAMVGGAQAGSDAADRAQPASDAAARAQPGSAAAARAQPGSKAAADLAAALSRAADVPVGIIALAAEIAGSAAVLAATGNPNLRGDAQSAALLAQAAASSAARLVAINLADAPHDPRIGRSARLLARIDVLTTEMASPP